MKDSIKNKLFMQRILFQCVHVFELQSTVGSRLPAVMYCMKEPSGWNRPESVSGASRRHNEARLSRMMRYSEQRDGQADR